MSDASASEAQPAAASRPVFAADRPLAESAAPFAPFVETLAALLVHPQAQSPFTIGFFGSAGSGKSSLMHAVLERARALGGARKLLPVHVDASEIGPAVAGSLAARVYEAVGAEDGSAYATLAMDCAHAGRDPLEAAHEAGERLADIRRKLDAERLALNELDGRRARLVETVLYDSGGSRIESFARANRTRLENRLRGFGFLSNDPVATYKDLVRDVFERGVMGRVGAFFHSLWAFRGQTKLIVWAIGLFLLSWGFERLFVTRDAWLGWLLTTAGEKLAPTIDFVRDNAGLLNGASKVAMWGGVLALVVLVLRALRFTIPVLRGVSLLRGDIETRRRELDGLISHQTRRVDAMEHDSTNLARRVEEAERRLGGDVVGNGKVAPAADNPFHEPGQKAERAARSFLASFGRELEAGGPGRPSAWAALAIDNLAGANGVAAAIQQIAARPGFVSLLACEAATLGADRDSLHRSIQLPFDVDAAREAVAAGLDAGAPAFGTALNRAEDQRLGSLDAVFVAGPRASLRLRNLYAVARSHTSASAAAALLLAIDINGTDEERRAAAEAGRTASAGPLEATDRLTQALVAAARPMLACLRA